MAGFFTYVYSAGKGQIDMMAMDPTYVPRNGRYMEHDNRDSWAPPRGGGGGFRGGGSGGPHFVGLLLVSGGVAVVGVIGGGVEKIALWIRERGECMRLK